MQVSHTKRDRVDEEGSLKIHKIPTGFDTLNAEDVSPDGGAHDLGHCLSTCADSNLGEEKCLNSAVNFGIPLPT